MTIGQRIACKRKELALSQEALGEALGVSRQAIYKWESDTALPEIDKLISLSKLFGVSVGWLLGVEEESEAPNTQEPAPETVAEVVEPVFEAEVSVVQETPQDEVLVAMAPKAKPVATELTETYQAVTVTEEAPVETVQEVISEEVSDSEEVSVQEAVSIQEELTSGTWVEDDREVKEGQIKTSLVLSGLAGTNSTQNSAKGGVIRRPTLSAAPIQTSISQTEPGDSYSIPLSFGVGTKIGFNSRWSLGLGVNYTLLSRKFYGDYTKVENGQITESLKSDIRNTQHYVGIPVNAYYNIVDSKFVNFYAYAGGAVEKCVADEYRVLAKDILHKEGVKGVQTSANLGIGVEFMIGNHLGIYIDPSARYYFNCNQPKSIRTAQPLMLGFEMGLRVNL